MAMSNGGRLTTHVLDSANGSPARGMRVVLSRADGAMIVDATTNHDGRCDAPLLADDTMEVGLFELVFHAGDYFRGLGAALPDPAFLETVPVRFGIADVGMHYHVPLLVSPYGYSTYRGS